MPRYIIILFFGATFLGCSSWIEVDITAPSAPRGLRTLALDNAVELRWISNTEHDLAGYKVWVAGRYDGRYELIGRTTSTIFTDYNARNGSTYYYGVTAYDFDGNESEMSTDMAYATPRPEGYGVTLTSYRSVPNSAGYDFSTYSVGPYDDDYTDVFFEHFNGRFYLNVWNDTDIQDMGFTRSIDEIRVAPANGWSPSRSVEAIVGHTYVIWTWDDHYAKVRVVSVSSSQVRFDWAYQTMRGNPELKRAIPPDGKRDVNRIGSVAMDR
jgi:hypothetical protein